MNYVVNLDEEDEKFLIKDMHLIFDYLKNEIIPKLTNKIDFEFPVYKNWNDSSAKLYFTIYPKAALMPNFKLIDDFETFYFMPETGSWFIPDKSSGRKINYLNNSGHKMYAFVENWNYIKSNCLKIIETNNEIKSNIRNFKV